MVTAPGGLWFVTSLSHTHTQRWGNPAQKYAHTIEPHCISCPSKTHEYLDVNSSCVLLFWLVKACMRKCINCKCLLQPHFRRWTCFISNAWALLCCLVTVLDSTHAKGMTHMSAEINGMFNTLVRKVWKLKPRYEGGWGRPAHSLYDDRICV